MASSRVDANVPDERRWDAYKLAVEEYRFQVELNWKRTQYFFVLAVAFVVAAAGLVGANQAVPDVLLAALFLTGITVSAFAWIAEDTQHGYYRAARDHKRDLERRFGLSALGPATTPGQGSARSRRISVRSALRTMLGAVAVVHGVGLVSVLVGQL